MHKIHSTIRAAAWLAGAALTGLAGASDSGTAGDSLASLEIISSFGHGDKSSAQSLHIALFTPADHPLDPAAPQRVRRTAEELAAYFSSEMARHGFPDHHLRLAREADGQVIIHHVPGEKPAAAYSFSSGQQIADEVNQALGQAMPEAERHFTAVFASLTSDKDGFLRASGPVYATGTHRSGMAWLAESPFLDPDAKATDAPPLWLGNPSGREQRLHPDQSRARLFGTTAVHMGNLFGLPAGGGATTNGHPLLMGANSPELPLPLGTAAAYPRISKANALQLAAHPLFRPQPAPDTNNHEARLENLLLSHAVSGKLRLDGRVAATPPVHAVIVYAGPAGGAGFPAHSASAVPDASGYFSLTFGATGRQGPANLNLLAVHANGAASLFRHNFYINSLGNPEIDALRASLALHGLTKAARHQDQDAFRNARADAASLWQAHSDLKHHADHLATILDQPDPLLPTPAEIAPTTTQAHLSDTTPTDQSVGWLGPARNLLPQDTAFLANQGEIFHHGLYAHAPAHHVYDLDGRWKSFEATAGLADGYNGTVRFLVRGDGSVLWQSNVLRAGQRAEFNVDVSGIRTLELITDPTEDGNSSDWSLWLNPELKR